MLFVILPVLVLGLFVFGRTVILLLLGGGLVVLFLHLLLHGFRDPLERLRRRHPQGLLHLNAPLGLELELLLQLPSESLLLLEALEIDLGVLLQLLDLGAAVVVGVRRRGRGISLGVG